MLVIIDSQGRWITGRSCHIGVTTNNIALTAWDMGIKFLNVKVD